MLFTTGTAAAAAATFWMDSMGRDIGQASIAGQCVAGPLKTLQAHYRVPAMYFDEITAGSNKPSSRHDFRVVSRLHDPSGRASIALLIFPDHLMEARDLARHGIKSGQHLVHVFVLCRDTLKVARKRQVALGSLHVSSPDASDHNPATDP